MHSCEDGLRKHHTNQAAFRECSRITRSRIRDFARSPRYKRKMSIRERRRRERRKFGTFFLCLRSWFSRKTARTRQSFENAPESRAHEHAILCELTNTKGKGRIFASAEGASGENFGTFYGWYARTCPQNSARLVLAKNARPRGVFRKRCRITLLRIRDFARTSQQKGRRVFASAEGASGENLVHFTCVLRKHARLRGWFWQKNSTNQAVF